MMPFHIIGHAGSGKTTFIAELVQTLVRMDLQVGTLKHSPHAHELDKPGKDSYIHRTAGAATAAMVTRDLAAVYLPRTPELTVEKLLETHYRQLDITLIEGWISGPFPKIEVWRKTLARTPLLPDLENTIAIVTDDPLPGTLNKAIEAENILCFKRNDVNGIATWLLDAFPVKKNNG